MNTEQILTSISSLQTTVSVQQQQNASLISMAELLDSVFEHRTEVVSYRNLSHEELEAVATEYDTLLSHLRNVFYSVSKIAMDNDSVFGHVNLLAVDASQTLATSGGAVHAN
jgi:hypothetical protein